MTNHPANTSDDRSLLRRFVDRSFEVGFFITLFAFTASWVQHLAKIAADRRTR